MANRVRVPRRAAEPQQLQVGGIFNCTGSNFDITPGSPLAKKLLKAGLLCADGGLDSNRHVDVVVPSLY